MGTFIVIGILAAAVIAAIVSIVKKHKSGKSICGCGCSHCDGCK